jgi:hypothetical protein
MTGSEVQSTCQAVRRHTTCTFSLPQFQKETFAFLLYLGGTMKRIITRGTAVAALALIAACQADWNPVTSPGGVAAAAYPSLAGAYTGTGVGRARTSTGQTYSVSCPLTVTVDTQSEGSFAGGFTAGGDCDSRSGTISGTVQEGGAVAILADTPGGGADIWEDAAAQTGCTLISTTRTLDGALSGNVITASGSGVYNCPTFFGGVRVNVDVSVTVTRG